MNGIKRVVAVSLLVSVVHAREIRTPWNLQQGQYGALHALIEGNEDRYRRRLWDYDVWGGAYAQSAHESYNDCHDKVPLSTLFFGKSDFIGKELFANSTVSDPESSSATWLSFANLSPRVEYDENGVVLGFNATRRFERHEKWRTGLRVQVPVRVIEMHQDDCCGECACDLGQETLNDVCIRRSDDFPALTVSGQDFPEGVISDDWACRLDFLSALCYSSCSELLVKYGTGGGDPTTIAEIAATEAFASCGTLPGNSNSVHLVQIDNGTPPTGELGLNCASVQGLPALGGGGAGPGNGQRTKFAGVVDYSALSGDIAAQKRYWLVPTLWNNTGSLQQTPDAIAIRNAIDEAVSLIATSVMPVFNAAGISFGTEKIRGLGDTDTNLFVGYQFRDNLYLEGQTGVRWPTGKRIKTPNRLYLLQPGNNGHFEWNVGYMSWWAPYSWLLLKSDARFNLVFNREEKVAASFAGATVKNIGPVTQAEVNWEYFVGHVDVSLLNQFDKYAHRDDHVFGFNLGYEFYWKSSDHICFVADKCDLDDQELDCCGVPASAQSDCKTGIDLLGVRKPLDSCVLERYTDRLSSKINVEFFSHWKLGEIFAGWSQVIAGKNIMQETAYQIGLNVRF